MPILWVLQGRLAIGPAPLGPQRWLGLRQRAVAAVVSLCEVGEVVEQQPPVSDQTISWSSCPLPDARSGRPLQLQELNDAINLTRELVQRSPAVYVHCWAGRERAPLVALGVLCLEHCLDVYDGLAYLRRVHPAAHPTNSQLALLDQWLSQQPGVETCA